VSTAGSEELALRVKTYIDMVRHALKQVEGQEIMGEASRKLVELAALYLKDSEHYFQAGDYATALSCIAYAEGLLDALNRLGHLKIEWRRKRPKKVMVGGTFDLMHPGHIYYLKEAAKRGLVYAVVATDENVMRIKGKKPILTQEERLEVVSAIKYVYKALIGDEKDFIKPIEEVKPDLILLGPDQPIDEDYIVKEAARRGVKVEVERLPKRVGSENASTSKIIREIIKRYGKN